MSESNNEYHVASFVAQASPELVTQLSELIGTFDGTEIHGANQEQGKIVFTVEADTQKAIARIVDNIRLTNEFFSISPIYHQFLTEPEAPEIKEVN